ncbi:pentapeptide repeat-containing protein [Streptomyces sp. NRRL F-2890]|uniref:pentapeptide repeat-containing protein n=1 Tax=Streptomyces sp. NRRL F-2890 TaxID=1463845 RepID=UPI0004CC1E08|nr:pentapeptide repeat-containing protein [Streptomyces sp. NRRL F-2890]
MSAGTRNSWTPSEYPDYPATARRLEEWLASASDGLEAIGFDFRGADLSRGVFRESILIEASLQNVNLSGSSLYRSNLEAADLTRANLSGADLVRVNLDDAVLRSARLDRADMTKASLYGVDASEASFRGTRIMGASFLEVDLRGADLSGAILSENSFRVKLDENTIVSGLNGTIFGPADLFGVNSHHALQGDDLQHWINDRGGQVEVLRPRGPRST